MQTHFVINGTSDPLRRAWPEIVLIQRLARRRRTRSRGFTMIEVALSLGILVFALVAIIGVLPSGMKVQRENREQTIINQDLAYLLEAIRSGSKGVDDLTNYVESITVQRGTARTTYTNTIGNTAGFLRLTNAQHIVALLSTPKYEWLPNGTRRLNWVTARMRAITGNALDKGKGMQEFALRYEVRSEVVPYAKEAAATNIPPALATLVGGEVLRAVNLRDGLYEVSLTARWPLFQKGATWDVGRSRRTMRTLVSGRLFPLSTNLTTSTLYQFEPDTFISTH